MKSFTQECNRYLSNTYYVANIPPDAQLSYWKPGGENFGKEKYWQGHAQVLKTDGNLQ